MYQGLYTAIARGYGCEVVPVLREFRMRAMRYNPLAGAILTGRYSSAADLKAAEGRSSRESAAANP